MKILIVSAHPDDAETGAGGICARAVQNGHSVVIVHLGSEVRGRKIDGRAESEVRKSEAQAAARILGATVDFFDFGMSEYPATVDSREQFEAYVKEQSPDLVLTQWPVDTHPDHQVTGILALRTYIWQQTFCLGFYEVFTGIQTLAFSPNRYVDVSSVMDIKRRAILAHVSQAPQNQVDMHDKMSTFRGLEMGVAHAEAFHILGGQTQTAFDELFKDRIVHHDSGGRSLPPKENAGN